MKRIISLLLVAVMLLTLLAGCSGSDAQDASSTGGSSAPTSSADKPSAEAKPVKIENPFTSATKGYIDHTLIAEFTVKTEDGYECTGEDMIFLPKDSIISSDKEFSLHTYVKMDGGITLNTNIMRSMELEVKGYNSTFKAGSYTTVADCYFRISVKGKLSDISISVPDGTESSVFIGNVDTIDLIPKITAVNDSLINTGKSVNYIFISDLHNGSFVNYLDDDELRDYDSLDATASRLETQRKKVAQAVILANASPYIDFVVIGGDIINGYETTESNTYKEAKKKNPKLTVSQHCIDQIQEMLEPLKDCEKPVFVLAGNHDDNSGHHLWQENHPEGPSLYTEYLVSDLDWQKEIFSEFVNVKVVQDNSYTYSGKKLSKYYYYDLEKHGKTTRIICLDYNDDRFTFDSKGVVTSSNSSGGYSSQQLKWFAETALSGDFDDCILLSHASVTGDTIANTSNSPLQQIINAYSKKIQFIRISLGINVNFSGRKSGDILSYHHGHDHEDINTFNYESRYWTVASNAASLEILSASKDSVYRIYVDKSASEMKELTRSGTIK